MDQIGIDFFLGGGRAGGGGVVVVVLYTIHSVSAMCEYKIAETGMSWKPK